MVILKETYQSIQKACWGNIPFNFKFQDVSLVRPHDSRGHNDPFHDPVTVGSSSYRALKLGIPSFLTLTSNSYAVKGKIIEIIHKYL
jgi:hypothetical protein